MAWEVEVTKNGAIRKHFRVREVMDALFHASVAMDPHGGIGDMTVACGGTLLCSKDGAIVIDISRAE